MKLKELFESPENALAEWEDLLHHIAEEELVACKVHDIELIGKNTVKISADCQDVPRKEGYQKDLSDKVTKRLKKHPLQHLHVLTAKVYHANADAFKLGGDK